MLLRSHLLKLILCFSVIFIPSIQSANAGGKKGLGLAIGVGAGLLLLNELGKKSKEKKKKVRSKKKGSGYSTTSSEYYDSTPEEDVALSYHRQAEFEAALKRERNKQAEKNRNVLLAINDFIKDLKALHSDYRISQLKNNQVTQGEIERVVDEVYKFAHLYKFDRFSGEIWTRDRLKVQIIREAAKGLDPYFHGVGAKGPKHE